MSVSRKGLQSVTAILALACASTGTPPAPEQAEPERSAPVADATQVAPAEEQTDAPPETLLVEHISSVVAAAASRVKQECWQPALDTRTPQAPTTVRVFARTQIDPSGDVVSVDMQGAPEAYPGLADCVANVVRSLKFERALRTTSANIPFVLAAR